MSALGHNLTIDSNVDCHVCVEARKRLRTAGYSALRKVAFSFNRGVLKLSGRVDGYYLKQIAQELTGEIPGVTRIDNRIRVSAPSQSYLLEKVS